MLYFRKIALFVFLFLGIAVSSSYAQLAVGEIAFVQYNADGVDNFAFVCLVDIPGSEIIKFTDNEENDLSGGEGTITWTAPVAGVTCGTIITITTAPAATVGTVTEVNDLNFAGSGDGLIAYQGTTAAPTFITALGNDGATAGVYSGTREGALPAGLTLGTNAQSITEIDNAIYSAVTTSGTKAILLAAIYNSANWSGSNTVNQTYAGAFTVTSCTAPCTPPTIQANTLTFTSVTSTSMQINWTNAGNGTGQLVVIKAGSAVTSSPVNGTAYTANTIFGAGSDIGTSEFVVHNTDGGPAVVTGLLPNIIYYVSIFEYNTIDNCFLLTAAPTSSQATLCNYPTLQSSAIIISSVSSTGMTIGWTNGNGSNRIVVVKSGSAVSSNPVDGTTYTANTIFGSGTLIGTGNYVVYANTGSSVAITGLSAGTTYYVGVYEYNNSSKCYLTTTSLIGNQITNVATSDIISVASSEAATVSSIINTAGPLTSVQGVQVWQFQIRDGAGAVDADAFPTIVTAINFTQNAGNAMGNWLDAIKSADLFDGSTYLGSATITTNQLQFSGLTITTPDNTNKIISLRISLNCGLSDVGNVAGDDFVFQISQSNVTTQATGSSGFNAFTSINSTNGQNVYTVVATELRYSTQSSNTGIDVAMVPVVVNATDACGNVDVGVTGTVAITSTGTLAAGSTNTASMVAGVATFSNIQHSVVGTGFALTATLAGLTNGVSGLFDILLSTAYSPGDFAFVGVNTSRLASGGSDEICFITFKDINAGTSFDLTDNGYERLTAGTWGDTEGTVRFTRKASASTISAGTVICIEGPDVSYDGDGFDRYDIYICGVPDDANWTKTQLAGSINGMDWNGSDQVWIMQGGSWNVIPGSQNDTYTGGNVLYGWTALNWEVAPGYSSTSGSTIYPNLECLNTDVAAPGNKTKYTGLRTAADKFTWISRINNAANWTGYADNATYDAGGTDYYLGTCAATKVTVNPNTRVAGKWAGGTSVDWANCKNWETLIVPDATTTVVLPTGGGIVNEPNISTTGALANNITIESGRTLTVSNTGDFTISGGFTNNGTFTHTAGTVIMTGTSAGSIAGTSATSFFNLTINKTSANVTLNRAVTITNNLTLTGGNILTTATNLLTLIDNATVGNGTAAQAGNASSFVDGPIKKIGNDIFTFPTGDVASWARIGITAPTSLTTEYTAEYVKAPFSSSVVLAPLNNVSIIEYWNLSQGVNNDDVQITLFWENSTNSAINQCSGADLRVAHYNTTSSQWELDVDGVNVSGTCTPGTAGSIQTNAIQPNYSPFAFASKSALVNVLPIELIRFETKKKENKVVINWATATELNNDYFTILKSYDGVEFFELGSVEGAGNSNYELTYKLVDENPKTGLNYYQLKQTDFDGTSSLSEIKVEHFGESQKGTIELTRIDANNIAVFYQNDTPYTIYLRSIDGKLIQSTKVNNNIYTINMNGLSAGIYVINVITDGNTISRKIVK